MLAAQAELDRTTAKLDEEVATSTGLHADLTTATASLLAANERSEATAVVIREEFTAQLVEASAQLQAQNTALAVAQEQVAKLSEVLTLIQHLCNIDTGVSSPV